MWLEAKLLLTIIANIMIAIVLTQIILLNMLLGTLLLFAIGLIIMGDMIIGYQIKHNHLDVLMDPNRPDQETCILCDFSGHIDFIRTIKGPLGKREFIKYKKEASIINNGDYPIRLINGNHGFIGHENYDQNVNLNKAEALDQLEGDDIKEIVNNLELVENKVDKL